MNNNRKSAKLRDEADFNSTQAGMILLSKKLKLKLKEHFPTCKWFG